MRSNTTALLLLLLLLLASSAIAHGNFLDFSSNGRATGVKFDTGYNLNAVQVVWEKYGRRLIHAVELYKGFRVARSQGACALEDEVAAAFYCALWYMHQYPTTDGVRGWLFGKSKRQYSKKKFYQCAIVVLFKLATMINEVHFDDRLHPDNHGTGIFSRFFTLIIDCAPIFVPDPVNEFFARGLYSTKYGTPAYKIQIGINFLVRSLLLL